MIVVADATPLNYMVQLDCDFLLPRLYERVLVPEAVIRELLHRKAPPAVSSWAASPPRWLEVRRITSHPDVILQRLDPGEREAIQLAMQEVGSIVLIDDERDRREAVKRGIPTTGTLGVLLAGTERGIFNGEDAFLRLTTQTTFRTSGLIRAAFQAKFAALRKRT